MPTKITAHVSPAAQPPIDVPMSPKGGFEKKFSECVSTLESNQKFVDRVIAQARRGRDFSPGELIAIQAGVYRYTQQMEAFSKLVDSATGALRRTLESTG